MGTADERIMRDMLAKTAARSHIAASLALMLCACTAVPVVPSLSPTPEGSAVRQDLQTRFADLAPGVAYPGSVWSTDTSTRLADRAFGVFPPDHQPGQHLTVGSYRLATALPSEPSTLDVALVGAYDDSWRSRVAQVVPNATDWDVVPAYSSLSSRGTLGPMPPLPSGLDEARGLLSRSGLLAPDMTPHPHPGPGRFEFIRHLGEIAVWTNLGVALVGLKDGGAQAVGRRRPILALSRYPLRPPGAAWSMLVAGEGQTMYVDDGSPAGPTRLQEFVVTNVELVYLELQVLGPREVMQPYYAFRDAGANVLYVPAVQF